MDDDLRMAHEAEIHAVEFEDGDVTDMEVKVLTSTYRYVCGYGWVADTRPTWTEIDFTVRDPRV